MSPFDMQPELSLFCCEYFDHGVMRDAMSAGLWPRALAAPCVGTPLDATLLMTRSRRGAQDMSTDKSSRERLGALMCLVARLPLEQWTKPSQFEENTFGHPSEF